jgi:hypothetical protein
MTRELFSGMFAIISGFITIGLIFAMVQRRRGRGSYFLFWPNRLGQTTNSILRAGTFRGSAAELSRIILFALITLIAASSLFEKL